MMHLQGIYVHQAIADFVEFYAMVSHPKTRDTYPKKPHPITKRKKLRDEIEQEEAVANYYINMMRKQDELDKMADKEYVGGEI